MQRTENDGVIISCDFCGSDWDPYDDSFARPMVEGHHGSVICLDCLRRALNEMTAAQAPFHCCMCLQDRPPPTPRWAHPQPAPSPGLNPNAAACKSCLHQAAGRFSKDPDVKWKWER